MNAQKDHTFVVHSRLASTDLVVTTAIAPKVSALMVVIAMTSMSAKFTNIYVLMMSPIVRTFLVNIDVHARKDSKKIL